MGDAMKNCSADKPKKSNFFKNFENMWSRITNASNNNSLLRKDAVITDPENTGTLSPAHSNHIGTMDLPNHLSLIQGGQSGILLPNSINQTVPNVTMVGKVKNYNITGTGPVTIGSVTKINMAKPPRNSCQPRTSGNGGSGNNDDRATNNKKINKTPTIVELMKSTDIIDTRVMMIASKNIGEGWRSIMRELDRSDATIDQTIEECLNKIDETIYRLLLDWKQNFDDKNDKYEPTVGNLLNVLWDNGQRECVVELKKYFKKLQSESRVPQDCFDDDKTQKSKTSNCDSDISN